MQHLNEDMDDLFRKAADEYPLKTGVPDWNRFAGRFDNSAAKPAGTTGLATPTTSAPKNYRRYLWFLVLLPVMFVCNYVYDSKNIQTDDAGAPTDGAGAPTGRGINPTDNALSPTDNIPGQTEPDNQTEKALSQTENADNQPERSLTLTKKSGSQTDKSANKNAEEITDSQVEDQANNRLLVSQRISINTASHNNKNSGHPVTFAKIRNKKDRRKNTPNTSLPVVGYKADKSVSVNGVSDKKLSDYFLSEVEIRGSKIDDRKHGSGKGNGDRQASFEEGLAGGKSPEPFDRFGYVSNTETAHIKGAMPLEDSLFNSITGNARPAPSVLKKTRKFYLGLMGGLDLSTVEFQKFSKTGWHYGGLAGYQFAKKWSIELGFFVDKKFYYTEGSYFSKGGLNLPSTSEVLWVDGDCLMFEVPVSIKYDIANTYKTNWFVTGGLSSYFMKKEKYEMLYLYTNSNSTAIHKYEYKNSSSNYFSEIKLSGGYVYKLPHNVSLRVEPYMNVPVSGVGYGKLKIFSGGINLGMVKRF